MEEVKIGHRVKDVVTGMTGIVEHIAYYPYMARRIAVQPDSLDKDGNMRKSFMIDEAQLQIVNKKPKFTPTFAEPRFDWGQPVKDPISGYEGKVTGRALYLNGCARICVQAPHDKKKEEFDDGIWFPEGQLEPVGKWKKKEEKPVKTGGPSHLSSSAL